MGKTEGKEDRPAASQDTSERMSDSLDDKSQYAAASYGGAPGHAASAESSSIDSPPSEQESYFSPRGTDADLSSPFGLPNERTLAEDVGINVSDETPTIATGQPADEFPTQAEPHKKKKESEALTTRAEVPRSSFSASSSAARTTHHVFDASLPDITIEPGAVSPFDAASLESEFGGTSTNDFEDDTTHTSVHVSELNSLVRHTRDDDVEVDFVIGDYHAVRRLGKGGMAEVFLARRHGQGEQVVLKRLHSHLSKDERTLKMFRREARIASRLAHPNIIKILDFVEEDDALFLVMEHLVGADFRDFAYRWWNTGRPLPIEPIVKLCAHAALGIDYLNRAPSQAGEPAHLVHRDISPENLFLTHEGEVKILDFGIARESREFEELTVTGEVKGKVPYMSPEQIIGDPLDQRSDLWSLTVVLYWLLTGHRPFDGPNDFMTIKQVMEVTPVPPADVNDLVPHALNEVVLKGLSKDKDQRFQDGRQMHDALMELLGTLDTMSCQALGKEIANIPEPEVEPVPYHPAAVPFARWLKT